jgi:glycosyltransferase involved in cell wall biosynthesis
LLPTLFRQKWRRPEPLRILFVGNDYDAKNGRLALRVLGRLARNHPEVRCTYVGTVPEGDLSLAEAVDYRGTLPRSQALQLFRSAHVLFHPAKAESFGMVFVEAAANGLAVVTAKGRGMEHLGELFDDRGALFLDRAKVPPEAEEECFQSLLESLIEDPRRAHGMGLANCDLATHGRLSLADRDDRIRRVYRVAESTPAERGLSLDETATSGGTPTLTLKSARVSAAHRAFRDNNGIHQLNFYRTDSTMQSPSTMQSSTSLECQYQSAYRETF